MRSVRLGAIWIILVTLAFSSYANEELENIFDQGYEAFVGRDYAGAADFWTQSASRGHVRSQNGLGVLYRVISGSLTLRNQDAGSKRLLIEDTPTQCSISGCCIKMDN